VVASLQDVFDELKDESLFRASFGLAGGVASTCEGTCGALAGGIMVLSHLYGRSKREFREQTPISLKKLGFPWEKRGLILARELVNRFMQEYGSIICKDIQNKLIGFKADFWTEEGVRAFDEAGGHKDKCPVVVGKTACWVAEMILRERSSDYNRIG